MYNHKKSIDAGDRVEAIDIFDNMLLVATSKLGGNVWDSSLRVIDLVTQDVVASVKQPCGCADASWASLGQRAVCAEDSGDVKVYRMDPDAAKQFLEIMTLQHHDDIVSSIAVCPSQDGLILSGSFDRSLHLWDIAGDRDAPLNTFTGHRGSVTGVEFTNGEDGGHIFASVSLDSGFRLWDRRQSYVCASHRLESPALSLSWEAISQVLIAVGCQNGTSTILDKRALAVPVSIQKSHVGRVNALRFSPATIGGEGSPLLASAGDDGSVTLRRVEKGREKRFALHSDYVKALAWRDANTLVTGGWDSQLCMMEIGQKSLYTLRATYAEDMTQPPI